jgi:hypothetical protein
MHAARETSYRSSSPYLEGDPYAWLLQAQIFCPGTGRAGCFAKCHETDLQADGPQNEVHGAMIRSYYAAKFNPTTMDFSSSFKDAASNQVFARGRYLPAPRPGVASKVQYSHEEGGGEEDVGNVRDGGSIRSVEERVVWSHESGGHI